MGAAEKCSILYLESRCVSLARALGSQGVQNGGIDGVGVVSSVPEGMKELLAENLMVMMRDLESCAGNDNLISESDIRRSAHTLPVLLAGADFIFSGFGSIPRYDNAFALSNFNSDDMDDFLVLQRDWAADGGLRTVSAEHLAEVRRRGATAVQAVYRDLGLADYDDERVDEVVVANGSRDLPPGHPKMVAEAAAAIEAKTAHGVRRDRLAEADRLRRRGRGDHAADPRAAARRPTADVGDLRRRLPGAVEDHRPERLQRAPERDTRSPSSGAPRSTNIRQARTIAELTADQDRAPRTPRRHRCRAGAAGQRPARGVHRAVAGIGPHRLAHPVRPDGRRGAAADLGRASRRRAAWRAWSGCSSTIDVGLIGLTAARLSGSGIGIGLQGKGTALIHRRDLAPLANLELFSVAPLLTAKMYRELGKNAAQTRQGDDAGTDLHRRHRRVDLGALPRAHGRPRRAGA